MEEIEFLSKQSALRGIMRYLIVLFLTMFVPAQSNAAGDIEQIDFNNIRTLEFLAESCIQNDMAGLEYAQWADHEYYRVQFNSHAHRYAALFEGEANNLWSPTRVVNNILLARDKNSDLCRVFGNVEHIDEMPLLLEDFIMSNNLLFQEEWDESDLDLHIELLTENTHKYVLAYRVSSASSVKDHIITLYMYRTHPDINLAITYEQGLTKDRIKEKAARYAE